MADRTIVASVAQISPDLLVAIPGDPPNVTSPAVNTLGIVLAVGNSVRLRVLPGGAVPEITGKA